VVEVEVVEVEVVVVVEEVVEVVVEGVVEEVVEEVVEVGVVVGVVEVGVGVGWRALIVTQQPLTNICMCILNSDSNHWTRFYLFNTFNYLTA
jgi:hypothetical protein